MEPLPNRFLLWEIPPDGTTLKLLEVYFNLNTEEKYEINMNMYDIRVWCIFIRHKYKFSTQEYNSI